MVCVHALGHGSGDFEALADALGGEFEFIALDWPGHGRSRDDGGPVSADRYAKLLTAVCDALEINEPIVLGHSIGGAAAAIAAAENPRRFSALVLCNPGGFAQVDRLARFVISRMVAFFEAGSRRAPWFARAFAVYYRTGVLARKPSAGRRRQIVSAAYDLAPVLAAGWRSFAAPSADIRGLVARLDVPVWLAWAKDDRFVAWSRSRESLRKIERSRVTLFPAAHAAFLETPEAFADAFRAFVRDVRNGSI